MTLGLACSILLFVWKTFFMKMHKDFIQINILELWRNISSVYLCRRGNFIVIVAFDIVCKSLDLLAADINLIILAACNIDVVFGHNCYRVLEVRDVHLQSQLKLCKDKTMVGF